LSFRFERLLKLRRNQQYQAHKLVLSIHSQLMLNQASLELLMEKININKKIFNQCLQSNMDIKTRRIFDQFFDSQIRKRDIKIEALKQITNKYTSKRAELISAIKNTKTLEILKHRKTTTSRKAIKPIENISHQENSTFWRG